MFEKNSCKFGESVIFDVMNDHVRPRGIYPENVILISLADLYVHKKPPHPHPPPPQSQTNFLQPEIKLKSTRNFQSIFLRVKEHHPWHQEWPCPPCLWSRTPTFVVISDLEDFECSWLETWRTWVIFDILNVLNMWFPTYVQNFSFLAWLEVCQEPAHHHQWLGGHWGFLTRDMEDNSHPWHNG